MEEERDTSVGLLVIMIGWSSVGLCWLSVVCALVVQCVCCFGVCVCIDAVVVCVCVCWLCVVCVGCRVLVVCVDRPFVCCRVVVGCGCVRVLFARCLEWD